MRATWFVVDGELRRGRATCLERSYVLQAWWSAQGRAVDIVVGVGRVQRFPAHAWLDGMDPDSAERYVEIHRVPA